MRRLLLAACAALLFAGPAHAVVCSDRTPAPITAVGEGSRKCQETIAKEGAKFLRAKMKFLASCNLKSAPGTCPTAKDNEKIEKAATKAADQIAKQCGDDTVQAGLQSSYKDSTDPAVISSCMLSQHNVSGGLVVANAHGPTTEAWPGTGKDRANCIKELSKQSWLVTDQALKHTSGCVKTKTKEGTAGDLAPICVGRFSSGSFVPPSDSKTASKLSKLFEKTEGSIAKKCAAVETLDQIETLFGCAGATSVADLQKCIVCQGWDAALNSLEEQYSEGGTFVANGPGAIQAAVDATSTGDKLLIGSGTYQEEVLVSTEGLSLVGCGGATDDRPHIIPPPVETSGRGIRSNGPDGLLFQSIKVSGQQNDGIRVQGANGVTFRDVVGDGELVSSYAVFPINSNNVVIELCRVYNVDDAPLYVGQSSGIIVRYNDVRASVAGIEIENSDTAQVYSNCATGNTAGIMAFRDGNLPVQLSECHDIHHNLLDANNTPNFGSGSVGQVPAGTGILSLSVDESVYHHNISRNNRTFGIAFTDQATAGFLPVSPDTNPDNNYIFSNIFTDNGFDPDFAGGFDALSIYTVFPGVGNCQSDNVFTTEALFTSLPACTLPPPAFPSCPSAPIGSPSGAFLDGTAQF